MRNSQRVVINTIAQYTRTVINMLLSLYTVRIVLSTLGASDYGVYTVVAGVTSMLAFITNALVSTTQRFMSYYQGKNDANKMKEIFSNSELLHLVIGLFLVILLLAMTPLLFNGFLNIEIGRIEAAKRLYFIIIVVLFTTFCTAPFRALLVSHENIVYISIIDVLDGILKVILVSILPLIPFDKLILYGFILLGVQMFNFLALSIYSFNKYEECIVPKISLFNKQYVKDLSSYAGWVVYGTGCVIGRTQGIAIVVNKFLSTVANAAYGVGLQVSNAISTISTALLNAMRPQIVKAEGGGDHARSMALATFLCKFSFFLLSALCIPCIFEMPRLLEIWLKDVPEYTVLFARMALFASLADTLTLGLSVSNEAIGNIKQYNLLIATIKLIALPIAILLMQLGYGPISVVVSFVGAEFLAALLRLPLLHKTGGLIIGDFIKNVFLYELIPLLVCTIVCYSCVSFLDFEYRFLLTFVVSFVFYSISVLFIGLTEQERDIIFSLIQKRI